MAGKKRRVSIRIDMTPMVDIAFLLLIFYMATTTFKPPEARAVELPTSHSQIELPDKGVINITVSSLDSIFVDWTEVATINIDGEDVTTTVRVVRKTDSYMVAKEINQARSRSVTAMEALIVIKADRGASFGIMRDVMKRMQENHLERFLIITDPETDDA